MLVTVIFSITPKLPTITDQLPRKRCLGESIESKVTTSNNFPLPHPNAHHGMYKSHSDPSYVDFVEKENKNTHPRQAPTDSRKRLALAIIDYLSTSLQDGTLQAEDADSIEIASNCIAECFHVDPSDQTAVKDALGGQNLLNIYGVYEKLKGKSTASTSAGGSSAQEGKPSTPTLPQEGDTGGPTPESERLKSQGNTAMQRKDYQAAIDSYTAALAISPLNPIYLSNRAAAFSNNLQHDLAQNDAELATATDPKYTKAWSRLGLARFALGDAKGSMEAYQQGIEAEGNGGSEAMKKGYETARKKVEAESADEEDVPADMDDVGTARAASPAASGGGGMPDLAGLASMLGGRGGGGGGGGGGGMPDLSSIMQNPMLRNMAQNLMSNPEMMSNVMNNPQLRNMASRFGGGGGAAGGSEGGAAAGAGGGGGGGGGGGMPNLSEMMNDPAIAEM